jgi:hypothetical protein
MAKVMMTKSLTNYRDDRKKFFLNVSRTYFVSKWSYLCQKFSDPHSILGPPLKRTYKPDDLLKSKIARYFKLVINKNTSDILKRLPNTMPAWGRVKIGNGGDTIRTANESYEQQENLRDMTYVRVSGVQILCMIKR